MGLLSGVTDFLFGWAVDDRERSQSNQQMDKANRIWREQYNITQADKARTLQTLTADARAAGLHPLFALGGGSGSGGQPIGSPIPSTSGAGAARMADGLAEAVDSFIDKDAREAAEKMALRSQNAIIREQEANASLAETQLAASQLALAKEAAMTRQDWVPGFDANQRDIVTPSGKFKTGKTTRQQEVEDNYGGVAGELYGLWRLLDDAIDNSGVVEDARRSLKPNFKGKQAPRMRQRRNR